MAKRTYFIVVTPALLDRLLIARHDFTPASLVQVLTGTLSEATLRGFEV